MKTHTKNEDVAVKKWIAPCGLNCYTCSGNKHGIIAKNAKIMQKYMNGFSSFAPFLADFNPIYKDYTNFDAILNDLAAPNCEGCQSGNPLNQECGIFRCPKLEKQGTCATCDEFPCQLGGADESFLKTWKTHIMNIREQGLVAHWKSTKSRGHFDK